MAQAEGAIMQVKLYKKIQNYVDKNDGEEKSATNFYLQCGTELIPIAVRYFPDKESNVDANYRGRKMVLGAIAEILPEKAKKISAKDGRKCPNCHKSMILDDKDLDSYGNGSYYYLCEACGSSVIAHTNGEPDDVDIGDGDVKDLSNPENLPS